MTGGVVEVAPGSGVNPMVALQRRAFGFGGSGAYVQLAIAVIGPIAAFGLSWGRVPGLIIAAAVLVPTPALFTLLALRTRSRWPAQDVLGWIDREAGERWRSQTATLMPRNSAAAAAWLDGHKEGDVPADAWVAALLMAGRTGDARAALARMPQDGPSQLHRRLDLEMAADSGDGRRIDSGAADAAATSDPEAGAVARAVHLAYHAAVAAESLGSDGMPALASARPAIGRLPLGPAVRMLPVRFRYTAISALTGAWLLVAVVIGLGASGGVVWI